MTFAILSVRTEKSKVESVSSNPKNVNSNYSRVIRILKQKKKRSKNHAKGKLISTGSQNEKIRREVMIENKSERRI